jgi:cell division protease FtsH
MEHKDQLARIADALIEYETLDAADIDVLMGGGNITRTPPPKAVVPPAVEKGKRGGLLDAVGGVPAPSKA